MISHFWLFLNSEGFSPYPLLVTNLFQASCRCLQPKPPYLFLWWLFLLGLHKCWLNCDKMMVLSFLYSEIFTYYVDDRIRDSYCEQFLILFVSQALAQKLLFFKYVCSYYIQIIHQKFIFNIHKIQQNMIIGQFHNQRILKAM